MWHNIGNTACACVCLKLLYGVFFFFTYLQPNPRNKTNFCKHQFSKIKTCVVWPQCNALLWEVMLDCLMTRQIYEKKGHKLGPNIFWNSDLESNLCHFQSLFSSSSQTCQTFLCRAPNWHSGLVVKYYVLKYLCLSSAPSCWSPLCPIRKGLHNIQQSYCGLSI